MKKNISVKCSSCKKEFNYYDSEFRPFCSKRCKMIDLGQWLNESYSVPVVEFDDIEVDEERDDDVFN